MDGSLAPPPPPVTMQAGEGEGYEDGDCVHPLADLDEWQESILWGSIAMDDTVGHPSR